jgi:hypothetical protein
MEQVRKEIAIRGALLDVISTVYASDVGLKRRFMLTDSSLATAHTASRRNQGSEADTCCP